LVLGLVVIGLLALGAVPSYLGTGPTYHLTVTPASVDQPTSVDQPAVNVSDLSGRRYPYLAEALAAPDGRSSGYQRGQFGVKEAFTHSPFDEVDGLRARQPNASVEGDPGDAVRIVRDGQRYVVRVVPSGTGG
jgi:hypothetical protein